MWPRGRRLAGWGSAPSELRAASPVVPEDGVIHHPTRLSEGPARLTAAIYLDVIGSKLARGRAVSKEGAGGAGVSWEFPGGPSRAPGLAATRGVCAVRGAEPTGHSGVDGAGWRSGGQPGELSTALGGRWELGQLGGETSGRRRWRAYAHVVMDVEFGATILEVVHLNVY